MFLGLRNTYPRGHRRALPYLSHIPISFLRGIFPCGPEAPEGPRTEPYRTSQSCGTWGRPYSRRPILRTVRFYKTWPSQDPCPEGCRPLSEDYLPLWMGDCDGVGGLPLSEGYSRVTPPTPSPLPAPCRDGCECESSCAQTHPAHRPAGACDGIPSVPADRGTKAADVPRALPSMETHTRAQARVTGHTTDWLAQTFIFSCLG